MGPGQVPGPRAVGLRGLADQRPAGPPVPASQHGVVYQLQSPARTAAAHLSSEPLARGPDGLMAPPGLYLLSCPRAWCAVGKERPLLPVSGRERVHLHAALPTPATRRRCCWMKPVASRRKARSAYTSTYWPLTPTRHGFMSSATMPATTKTTTCGSGWRINPSARCFCRLTRLSCT